MRVPLYFLPSAALLVAAPTGIVYCNQVANELTIHQELEGFLVPLPEDALGGDSTLGARLDEAWPFDEFLTDEDELRPLKAILDSVRALRGVNIDKSQESMPGWIPLIFSEDFGLVEEFDGSTGVLTWTSTRSAMPNF